MQISSDIDNVLLSDLYWLCIAKKEKISGKETIDSHLKLNPNPMQ